MPAKALAIVLASLVALCFGAVFAFGAGATPVDDPLPNQAQDMPAAPATNYEFLGGGQYTVNDCAATLRVYVSSVPNSYPSWYDPSGNAAQEITGSGACSTLVRTVNYSANGMVASVDYAFYILNQNRAPGRYAVAFLGFTADFSINNEQHYLYLPVVMKGMKNLVPNSTPTSTPTATATLIPTSTPTVLPTSSAMAPIPAGIFQMGCDPAHNGGYGCENYWSELPLHPVYLDAYRIDRTEVTNSQYAQCVAADGCTKPARADSSTRPFYYGNPIFENYPVVYVSWYQASAYCEWAGKRLPTEAEWEKATRGGSETRAYPWGDTAPTCTLANFDSWSTLPCVGDTSAVGSTPAGASPYGVQDMAGSVDEWVSDWFSGTYYGESPASNPTGPTTGFNKVLRGGAFSSNDDLLRVSSHGRLLVPTRQLDLVGFRCVAIPKG